VETSAAREGDQDIAWRRFRAMVAGGVKLTAHFHRFTCIKRGGGANHIT